MKPGIKKDLRISVILVAVTAMIALPASASSADEDPAGESISDFKTMSLFRGVELTWKVKNPFKKEVAFQILRSDSFSDGPYKEVATVSYVKENIKYTYIDKRVSAKSKYYYKLVATGSGEIYGPVPGRPFFALPST